MSFLSCSSQKLLKPEASSKLFPVPNTNQHFIVHVKGDKDNFYHQIMDKTEITEHSGKVEITEFSCYIVCQDKTHDEQICKHFFPFEIYFLRSKDDTLQCPHKEVLICFAIARKSDLKKGKVKDEYDVLFESKLQNSPKKIENGTF